MLPGSSLDLHVQECVRHYLSDWVYALRRYAEFGSAGVLQRAQETAVPTGGELHQEYEVDGVVEFSLSNGANKVRSTRRRRQTDGRARSCPEDGAIDGEMGGSEAGRRKWKSTTGIVRKA